MSLSQPMTAMQLSRRLAIKRYTCMSSLRDLQYRGLLRCLNPTARQSRVYWLTENGVLVQSGLYAHDERKQPEHDVPAVDWDRYGFVCFSHRAAIILALTEPLQAATIKRRARRSMPHLRMSANNVRDAMKLLLNNGIVRRTIRSKSPYPHYELADECRDFQRLLRQATWGAFVA